MTITCPCGLCSQRSYSIQYSDEPHYSMKPLTIAMRPYIFLQILFSFAIFNHTQPAQKASLNMSRYHDAPPGSGAAYLGLIRHHGPVRPNRGPPPPSAAFLGMYIQGGGEHQQKRQASHQYSSHRDRQSRSAETSTVLCRPVIN